MNIFSTFKKLVTTTADGYSTFSKNVLKKEIHTPAGKTLVKIVSALVLIYAAGLLFWLVKAVFVNIIETQKFNHLAPAQHPRSASE